MIFVTDGQMRQTLSIIRSFGRRGMKVMVGDSEKISTGFFSRYTSKRIVYPDPARDSAAFLEFLLKLVRKENIEMIIPVRDKCLVPLAKNKNIFEKYTRLLIPDYGTVMQVRNKMSALKLAEKHGIPVPKTHFVKDAEMFDVGVIGEYPVIVKPVLSSGSRGFLFCRDSQELKEGIRKNAIDYPDGLLVQDFIPCKEEISYYALLNDKSKIKAYSIQKRLRSYPVSGGPSTLRETVHCDQVQELGSRLLRGLGWRGVAMVEFRTDERDGIPKLMEVNPRFWGSLALSIAAGVDFPHLLYCLATGDEIESCTVHKVGVRCRWLLPGDLLWFWSVRKNAKNIKEFFRFPGVNYDVLAKDDIAPVIGVFISSFCYLLNREKRQYVFRR